MHHMIRLTAMEIKDIKNVGYGRLEFPRGRAGVSWAFMDRTVPGKR